MFLRAVATTLTLGVMLAMLEIAAAFKFQYAPGSRRVWLDFWRIHDLPAGDIRDRFGTTASLCSLRVWSALIHEMDEATLTVVSADCSIPCSVANYESIMLAY